MDSIKSALVAMDFSPCSCTAYREAVRIAEWNRASLSVLHVVPIPSYAPAPHPFLPFALPTRADFITDAKAAWNRFANECQVRPDTKFEISLGNPREVILENLERSRHDLLVLGTHSGQDAHKDIGPTASACMQRARTQVLLVRDDHAGPFKSIVACVDFTETSKLALRQAIRIAAQDGAALHILHVYDDPWYPVGPPGSVTENMPDFTEQFRRAVVERMREYCSPMTHEINALRGTFHAQQTAWRESGYGHAIVRFVTQEGCDLAVLGTRERWNMRDMIFGSTAERVVREAACSILAVKPELPAGG